MSKWYRKYPQHLPDNAEDVSWVEKHTSHARLWISDVQAVRLTASREPVNVERDTAHPLALASMHMMMDTCFNLCDVRLLHQRLNLVYLQLSRHYGSRLIRLLFEHWRGSRVMVWRYYGAIAILTRLRESAAWGEVWTCLKAYAVVRVRVAFKLTKNLVIFGGVVRGSGLNPTIS